MKPKTVLVVGGAGYIGAHVNKLLYQEGFQTIVLDDLSRGNQKAVKKGLFIQGNMGNRHDLDKIFKHHSIDAVMHFAAYISVKESVIDPAKYYLNNVANTLTLLKAMIDYDVKTLIFSSTAAVYGIPTQSFVGEDLPCQPINPYGQSKLMVEKILQDFDQAYGLRSCCLRYFNAAGGDPEREIPFSLDLEQTNLIPVVLKNLKISSSSPISIFGTDYSTPDGTCLRDYIHVCDLGIAHILALKSLLAGAPSSRYNLGNGRGFSVREVIAAAEQVTGLKVNSIEAPRREGDPPILVANAHNAQKGLGWVPKYPDLHSIISHAWMAMEGAPAAR